MSDTPDLWEQIGENHYTLLLAPRTAEQLFSGECDKVSLNFDLNRWWITVDGQIGSEDFKTIGAAKAMGMSHADERSASMNAHILESLDISDDDWAISINNHTITLTSKVQAEIAIVGSPQQPTWAVYDGDILQEQDNVFSAVLTAANNRISVASLGM